MSIVFWLATIVTTLYCLKGRKFAAGIAFQWVDKIPSLKIVSDRDWIATWTSVEARKAMWVHHLKEFENERHLKDR